MLEIVERMFGKTLFFRLLKAIAITSVKIIVVVGLILILDVMGLGLYGLFRGINAFGMFWIQVGIAGLIPFFVALTFSIM